MKPVREASEWNLRTEPRVRTENQKNCSLPSNIQLVWERSSRNMRPEHTERRSAVEMWKCERITLPCNESAIKSLQV